MIMPDVNLLIYAHRAQDPHHDFYRTWLETLVAGPEPFALSALVATAFVRVVTNPRIFADPTPCGIAVGVIDSIVEQPTCRLRSPGARHWMLTADLVRNGGATGKLVADAAHAAVAIEHGCTWATRDRGFERFQPHGLRWRHVGPEQAR